MNKPVSVTEVLKSYSGKRVYFEPLAGNHGDTLIKQGSLHLFKATKVEQAKKPEEADAIVINGGGAMNDIWKSGLIKLQKYSFQYPGIPLIVLPSSYSFEDTNFPSLVNFHQAPVVLFCREAYSLNLLRKLDLSPNVQLGLDHDMAFHLQMTAFIHHLKAKKSKKHILIVERFDLEATTNPGPPQQVDLNQVDLNQGGFQISEGMRRSIKWYIKQPLRHRFLRNRNKMGIDTPFAKRMLERVLADYPTFHTLPIYAADISNPYNFSFSQFAQLVAESAVVVTTRLHVAILAAMLDKPTYIKDGSYHKIRGVFEYSLKNKLDLHLIN